jgi:esterase FrsA
MVINGDADTALNTQHSVDLALGSRDSTLRLYPDADRCGMRHYREWLELSQPWLRDQLATFQAPV